ncbi:MAG: response regulator [Spirochaetia bacterium]|nr:response regulator [Spirochaetia bacterium]
MYLQRSGSEGNFPIAYIRCKIDSTGIVKYIISANSETSKLFSFDIDKHLGEPLLSLYPYFSNILPWHSIFLLPSIQTLPFTKEFLVSESEEYYSVTAMNCSEQDEVVFLIRDISFEHYLFSVQQEVTKTQFDVLIFLNEQLKMQDIITSNDKEYLTRPREELIGFSMREVFGNEFAVPMEELAISSKNLGKRGSMIYRSPEVYDTRRFKIIAQYITTKKAASYIISIKDISSNIDMSGSLTDSIHHGFIVHNKEGYIYSANERIYEMTGFTPQELVGENISTIISEYSSDSRYESILLNKENQLYRVNVSSIAVPSESEEQKIVTCITNITEIQVTERLLERKIAFENILFDLTSRIFTSNELSFDAIIHHALEVLGSFSGSDRSYIFLYRDGELMDNTHEWCAPTINPEIENLQHLPKEIFPNLIEDLSHGKEIYVREVNRLQDSWAAEREILLAQSVKSILFQPIIGENNNYGFIGFDAVKSNMSWNKEERQLLRYFANNLGELLARNNHIKQMKEMREKAEILAHERDLMNKELNSFFAKMSHEIRNSINSIIGMNNMLLDTKLDPYQLRLTKIVKSSSDFLINLVRDVLDYSRMDQSNIELNIISFSLISTIEQIISSTSQKAQEKGLSISFTHAKKIPSLVLSDPIKIGQIVSNLLSNAIKYSNDGTIDISTEILHLSHNEVTVNIIVKDEGLGIKKENIKKIFDPYYQVNEFHNYSQESTGLGLPIVKWLTKALHGNIMVESTYHKGSTFTVTIPLQIDTNSPLEHPIDPSWINSRALIMNSDSKRAKETAIVLESLSLDVDIITNNDEFEIKKEIINQENHPYTLCMIDTSIMNDSIYQHLLRCKKEGVHDNHLVFITYESTIENPALLFEEDNVIDGYLMTPIESSKILDEIDTKMRHVEKKEKHKYEDFKVLSPLKVLIVEDVEINQEIMLYLLSQVGIQCEAVNNGYSAIEKVKQHNYDVVLLDIRMPGLDGYETTRLIRALKEEENAHVPIIAMTANVSSHEKNRCLAAGMDEYLTKPIIPEELYGVLLDFLPREITMLAQQNRYEIITGNPNNPSISGIDVNKALGFLNNDKELFIRLINQFYNGYKDYSNLYNETALNDNNRIRFVHSVKSISANLGATNLSTLAGTLEKMIIEQTYEDYAQKQHEFMSEFAIVLDAIKNSHYFIIEKEESKIPLLSYSSEEALSMLQTLKEGLVGGKSQIVNKAILSLSSLFLNGLAKEKFTTLQNLTRVYNYSEAIPQTDEIIHLLSEQRR